MLDNKLITQQAIQFHRSDDCYIHTEKKDGGKYETCIAGGTRAITLGVIHIIDRLCEFSGKRFVDVLDEIKLIKGLTSPISMGKNSE